MTSPTFARAALTRFAFTYWLAFSFTIWLDQINGFEWIGHAFAPVQDAIVQWVGHEVLGIDYEFSLAETGSGDKTSDWVWLLTIASVALVGALAWAAIDRRRVRDERIREASRVIVRYTLSLVILFYGVSKVFVGQFPLPGDSRLLQPYGESSPMGLMWTFMGASPMYVMFAGAAETLGAALLWFRRTTTLGALVLAAVLLNVVMMNFCYDVPVKINSTHYLAMAVYLIAPDLRRLFDVLVLDRTTPPSGRPTLTFRRRWQRIAVIALRAVVIGYVSFLCLRDSWPHDAAGNSPFHGVWNVVAFSRNGKDVPADATHELRWEKIRFEQQGDTLYARWHFLGKHRGDLYTVKVDDAAHTMAFSLEAADNDVGENHTKEPTIVMAFRRDSDDMTLQATIAGVATSAHVQRLDVSKSLLITRGFHWVNEVPFNR